MSRRSSVVYRRYAGLTATLTIAMATAAFMQPAVGVLAPFLMIDMDLSRTQIGVLTTTIFLFGGLLAPAGGLLVDRVGGRNVLAMLFLLSGAAFVVAASSPTYLFLLISMAIAGSAFALGNPITNQLIAKHVDVGAQGLVMGIKQSGVQLGAFLAGALLPPLTLVASWRIALIASVAVSATGLLLLAKQVVPPITLRDDVSFQEVGYGPDGRSGIGLPVLALYAFFMGSGAAAVMTYLPLYAFEGIGVSATTAGLAASVMALAGIVARIGWGVLTYRLVSMRSMLTLLAGGAAGCQILLWLSGSGAKWLLWPAIIGLGATAGAWNTIAMLAVVRETTLARSGRASGVVQLAFASGLVTSPALFGVVVDRTGSYSWAWAVIIGAYLCAASVVLGGRRTSEDVRAG